MGPAFYIIAILGCGEAETACEEVGRAESRYQSIAACTAATEAAMIRHSDIPYPVVVAQCRPANAAAVKLMADDVNLPEPEPLSAAPRNYAGISPR